MALRQASGELCGSRRAAAGTGRADCDPRLQVPRSFLSTLEAGLFAPAMTGLKARSSRRPSAPRHGIPSDAVNGDFGQLVPPTFESRRGRRKPARSLQPVGGPRAGENGVQLHDVGWEGFGDDQKPP